MDKPSTPGHVDEARASRSSEQGVLSGGLQDDSARQQSGENRPMDGVTGLLERVVGPTLMELLAKAFGATSTSAVPR